MVTIESQSMLIKFILIIIFENFELKYLNTIMKVQFCNILLREWRACCEKGRGKGGGFNLLTNQIGKNEVC